MSAKHGSLSINSENIFPIIKKWLYSDHDIFVREMISNGCDAITKLRKLEVMGDYTFPEGYKPAVNVIVDPDQKTLKFIDNGIGMTADEVEEYITQIAFSGATEFLEKYKDKTTDDQMIGHFGLGFYSAFMVADEVHIDTLSYKEGSTPVHWTCDGGTEYEMADGNKTEPGTEITLFLNEESLEFANEYRMREVIEKYCSFMPVNIYLSKANAEQEYETIDEADLKKVQKENTEYTSELYKTMSSQLSETFTKQERAMKDAIKEIDEMQSSYMKTADRIIRDNQMIQQLQKQDYEKFARHMHENEKESADLWKNCNASMRQYVDSAAEGMKAVADSNRISEELLREDKKMIEDFEARVKEFTESQKMVNSVLDEVRRLLSEIKTAKNNRDIHLIAGQPWGYGSNAGIQELKDKLTGLEYLLEGQGTRQEALLDEIERSIREATKAAQKSRFGLFK